MPILKRQIVEMVYLMVVTVKHVITVRSPGNDYKRAGAGHCTQLTVCTVLNNLDTSYNRVRCLPVHTHLKKL